MKKSYFNTIITMKTNEKVKSISIQLVERNTDKEMIAKAIEHSSEENKSAKIQTSQRTIDFNSI